MAQGPARRPDFAIEAFAAK